MKLVLVRLRRRVSAPNGRDVGPTDEQGGGSYLEVSELGEALPAAFELAEERLRLLVHDLVRPYVAALGETLATTFTRVGTFTRVAPFMRLQLAISLIVVPRDLLRRIVRAYLQIPQLRKALAA